MDAAVLKWFSIDHGYNAYVTILTLLILGGFGFPIPEDIPLVLAGVAAARNVVSLQWILVACYIGVVVADMIIYLLGHRFGQRLLNWGVHSPFFPSLTAERVTTIREGLRRRRLLYIFIGRHFFPVRTATFLTAGTVGIPFLEFLAADAFAALVSVTIVVCVGYWLGGTLTPEVISHLVHQGNYYVGGLLVLGAVSYLASVRWKQRHPSDLPEEAKKELSAEASESISQS